MSDVSAPDAVFDYRTARPNIGLTARASMATMWVSGSSSYVASPPAAIGHAGVVQGAMQ
ncbi:hypothetical protein [Stenotrophomonas chelatiphaga]|uniref:hypothetical protein n=1 Tax=Stenotrophomonas chelatiphaga TaxID=517011 RepID=UPI00289CBDF6|nr:hypothetical protein [Stenotrophomonas chelatiphaga]